VERPEALRDGVEGQSAMEQDGAEWPEAERDGAEGAGARQGGDVTVGQNPTSSNGRGRGLSSSDALGGGVTGEVGSEGELGGGKVGSVA
jgi:hypothetical protein